VQRTNTILGSTLVPVESEGGVHTVVRTVESEHVQKIGLPVV
jgi:hypothetical protein